VGYPLIVEHGVSPELESLARRAVSVFPTLALLGCLVGSRIRQIV
jgi:hypothetical protein